MSEPITPAELRKRAKCVYLAIDQTSVADDIAEALNSAADQCDSHATALAAAEKEREEAHRDAVESHRLQMAQATVASIRDRELQAARDELATARRELAARSTFTPDQINTEIISWNDKYKAARAENARLRAVLQWVADQPSKDQYIDVYVKLAMAALAPRETGEGG